MSFKRRTVVILLAIGVMVAAAVAQPASRWWRHNRRRETAAKCRAARNTQRWQELHSLAKRWSAWDSQNADPWLFLAEAADHDGDLPSVARYLERVPETDAKALPALIELMRLQFGRLNEPLQGVAVCERILHLEPRAAEAHLQLIRFYAMSLQRAKLLRQIRAAIRVEREPAEAYVYFFLVDTFRLGSGVHLNERWLESAPQAEVFQVARVLHMAEPAGPSPDGETEQPAGTDQPTPTGRSKRGLVDELLTRFPHNVELLAYKAENCLTIGDTECMAGLLLQTPQEAEDDSRFWRFKGWLHETGDELAEAEAAYSKALELHRLDWNAMSRLAVVERRLQNVVAVRRLTGLVEQARRIRHQLRSLPAVEIVPPPTLAELADLSRECGEKEIAWALKRRLAQLEQR